MRFNLYTAAVSLFAIAGLTDAVRLTETPEFFIESTMLAEVDPVPTVTSPSVPGTNATVMPGSGPVIEHDLEKVKFTVDSIRKGVLALREAKVEAKEKTEGMVDRMTQAAAEK